MTNDVPFDRPLMGPTRFEPQSSPPVNLNLPPLLKQWTPLAAAHLLNRAFETMTTNAARLSALNHLVINNFNNTNYPGMVEMVLRLSAWESSKQNNAGNVKSYIGQAVESALLYLSSSILATNQQMRQVCNNATILAADQNHHTFLKMKDDLARLDLSAFNQPGANTAPNNYGTPAATMSTTAPLFDNYAHSYAQAHKPDPASSATTFGSQWSNQGQPTPVQPTALVHDPLKQNSWFANNEMSRQAAQVNQGSPSIPVVDFTQLSPGIPPAMPAPAMIMPVPVPLLSIVTCNGENEMDINTHALPYFGSTDLVIDLSGRRYDLKLEAGQLGKAGRRDINDKGAIFLEPSVMVETNLDSAIFTATVSKANNLHGGRQNQIYRQFLHILSPVACSEEAKVAMGVFTNAQSLGQVPDLFRSFLKIIRDPSNPQENEQLALNFYAYLDAKLRGALNDFLKYNLRLKTKVGSFSEDYAGLEGYLRKNRNENAAQALMVWSARFFDQLRAGYNQQAEDMLTEFFSHDSKASVGYFPTFQSITLVSLTNKELAYKVEETGSFVDPKTTGVLDDITQGLYRNKKDLRFDTSKDWLITSDDFRYRIAEDMLAPGKFYLFPG